MFDIVKGLELLASEIESDDIRLEATKRYGKYYLRASVWADSKWQHSEFELNDDVQKELEVSIEINI